MDKTLKHYARKTKSQSTRENVLSSLDLFFRHIGCDNPDAYIKNPKCVVQKQLREYLDETKNKDRYIAYVNMHHAFLTQLFELIGFKNGRSLEVELFFEPARYRRKEEYVPTKEDVLAMINSASSLKAKTLDLVLTALDKLAPEQCKAVIEQINFKVP